MTTPKLKIAIIGASAGQLPLVFKAKEMGIETHCFAWDKNAICKYHVDYFYPISIYDTDEIISKCKDISVDGIVTNASEETALASAVIAEALGLNNTKADTIRKIQNKDEVRRLTHNTIGIEQPAVYRTKETIQFPCVVKPAKGSAKRGVSFCADIHQFESAINYATAINDNILIEEYIAGDEYSVECLSFKDKHHVIQITQKVTTGYPHFVELEHHQPAQIDDSLKTRIEQSISNILSDVGFVSGATHVEIKIRDSKIYLIEINPRGGGDRISDTLVSLSTDCDFIKEIIKISIGTYVYRKPHNIAGSGIIYLSNQNLKRANLFDCPLQSWMVEREIPKGSLTEATSNYDRNGYVIYKSPLNTRI